MQQPKGIAVVLGVIFGLVIIGAVIGGVLLIRESQPIQVPISTTNTALQLSCNMDADCSTYCGADPCYQPICGVTTIGEAGSCTCRSICGPIVTGGNANTTVNTNASNTNTSSNVNATTNVNTNSTVSTTSWKVYTNSDAGYSFKYPSTWKTCNQSSAGAGITLIPNAGTCGPELLVFIQVNQRSANYDINKSIQDTGKNLQSPQKTTVQVAGVSSQRVSGNEIDTSPASIGVSAGYFDDVFVPAVKNVWEIAYVGRAAAEDLSIFNSILSTFTFTK